MTRRGVSSEFGVPAFDVSAAGDQLPEDVGKAGPLGLLLIVLLLIAVVLLVRSMNKHLRKVPKSFDKPPEDNKTGDTDSAKPPSS